MKKKFYNLFVLFVFMFVYLMNVNAQIISENFDNLTSGLPDGWVVEGSAFPECHWHSTKAYEEYFYQQFPLFNKTEGLCFLTNYLSPGLKSDLKTSAFSLVAAKDPSLSFDYILDDYNEGRSSQGKMYVIISKDGGNTFTDTLFTIDENKKEWTSVEISLNKYVGESNLSIMFSSVTAGYTKWQMLDNVLVENAPTCARATSLEVFDIMHTDASFRWKVLEGKGDTASVYLLKIWESSEYGVGEPYYSEELELTADGNGFFSHIVEGELYPGTENIYTITSVCGIGDESTPVEGRFVTPCDYKTLPFTYNVLDNNSLDICWLAKDYSVNKDLGLKLRSDTSFLMTPVISHEANDIEVRIDYMAESENIGFYYGLTSSDDLSDFDTLGFVKVIDVNKKQSICVNTAETKFAVAKEKKFVVCPTGEMYVQVLDIHQKPCCLRAEQLAVTVLDSASVELAWVGGADSCKVVFTDTTTKATIELIATENPVIFRGKLQPSTDYSVKLKLVCDDECISAWSDSVYFSTLCGAESIISESFESFSIPECWIVNEENTWLIRDLTSRYLDTIDGIYATYVDTKDGETAFLVPQPVVVSSEGQYDLSFAMYRLATQSNSTEGDGLLRVWVNNRPDTIGAINIATIDRYYQFAPIEPAKGWYFYEYNIPQLTGLVYVIFEGLDNGINDLYLDKISIYPAAACRKVSEIALGEVKTNSAAINWQAVEDQNRWIVEYALVVGNDTIKTDSVAVNAKEYKFDNLLSATRYTVRGSIIADCGSADGLSAGVDFEINFQTECEIKEIALENPLVENFESYENEDKVDICWMQSAKDDANLFVVSKGIEYRTSSGYETILPSQGSKMAYLSLANNSWMFHAVQLKAEQEYSISLDALECSNYTDAKLSFAVGVEPVLSTMTLLLKDSVIPESTQWNRFSVDFSVESDGVYYIGVGISDEASVVGIDSLVISAKAKEIKPIEIKFSPAPGEYEDSVTVSIEYLNAEEALLFAYSIDGTEPISEYKTPFVITETATVKARVQLSVDKWSETVEALYTIKKTFEPNDSIEPEEPKDTVVYELPVAPVFTPTAGEFEDSVVVALSCATEGTAIYYVLEDTVPTIASAKYAEELVIRETTTIAAVAALVDTLGNPILNDEELPYMSEVVRATYVIKIGNGIDNIELAAVVYAKGGIVYVDTEIGNMIEVYTVQGQRLYAAEATASLTAIDALGSDVVLVRVNGITVKLSIR